MAQFAQARLINGPFDDPGVIVDFRFGSRALLLDLGDLSNLSARELVRTSHVFVSHMHMDHFAGFDRLLRTSLYQHKAVELVGPPGFIGAVESKLRAYTWNLLDEESADFVVTAADWDGSFLEKAAFRARTAFAREVLPVPRLGPGLVIGENDFHVEGAVLDHGLPSLALPSRSG